MTQQPAETGIRVLAVAAHTGDALVGAGATLLAHHATHDHVEVVTLAGDEHAPSHGSAAHDAAALGAVGSTGGLLPCTIPPDGPSVAFLAQVIERTAPDVIYTHSEHDHDPDHRNTHRAVLAAARGVTSVYCFEMPMTTAGFTPSRFVDADEQMQANLRLLAQQPAGAPCANLHPQLLTRTARHWARAESSTYVEPLEVAAERPGSARTGMAESATGAAARVLVTV